jgi:hypothetical protein
MRKATLDGIKRAIRRGRASFVLYVETHDMGPIWDDIPHTADAALWCW